MSSKKSASKGKKGSKAPAAPNANWKDAHSHLFPSKPRNFSIGRDIRPAGRDLSRFVKWPRYIRFQRQKAILLKRLTIPPALNMFTKTIEKNQASVLFRLLAHYRPEDKTTKKERLVALAAAEEKGEAPKTEKPKVIKFGLNHVTTLIETKKAKLVIIAHDVDPIELVVWLPALCKRMDVPYLIVKGKSRLGHLVHQKNAAVLAITDVKKEHQNQLDQLVASVRPMYAEAAAARKWGGGILGVKAQARERIAAQARAAEAAKKSKF